MRLKLNNLRRKMDTAARRRDVRHDVVFDKLDVAGKNGNLVGKKDFETRNTIMAVWNTNVGRRI